LDFGWSREGFDQAGRSSVMGGRRPATDDGGSLFVHKRITHKSYFPIQRKISIWKRKKNQLI
jgi:hypothetical protein